MFSAKELFKRETSILEVKTEDGWKFGGLFGNTNNASHFKKIKYPRKMTKIRPYQLPSDKDTYFLDFVGYGSNKDDELYLVQIMENGKSKFFGLFKEFKDAEYFAQNSSWVGVVEYSIVEMPEKKDKFFKYITNTNSKIKEEDIKEEVVNEVSSYKKYCPLHWFGWL